MKKYALLPHQKFWCGSLLIVFVLTVLACVYAYFKMLLPLDVFIWDEAHHGFFGMQIFNDLRMGDWGSFWKHTNNQALWMPVHSWLNGVFLYLFGFSYVSARLSSLFLFFVCSFLVYFIGFEMSKEKGWLIGLISVALYLTSPLLLHMATVNMQEMLGIFVMLLLVYFMFRFMSVENKWKYLCIGFLISVAFWSKTNFAIQIILGLGLYQLSLLVGMPKPESIPLEEAKKKHLKKTKKLAEKKKNPLIEWLLSNVYIIAGFLPLFVLWWVTPSFERKFGLGVLYKTSLGSALYFPKLNFFLRAIFYLRSLTSSYSFSFWIGLGFLAALVASCFFLKEKKIRLAFFMFITNLIMISLVANIQERYISTSVPLIFVLCAYFIVLFVPKLKEASKPVLVLGAIIFVAVNIISDSFSFHRYNKEVANRSILFCLYKDSHNKFSPPFLFGLVKRPAFTYPMDKIEKYNDFKATPKSSLNDVMTFFSSSIDRSKSISTFISYDDLAPYVFYWHFRGWGARVFTANDFPYVKRYFWASDYFLDLQPASDSPYYTNLLEKRWNNIAPILLKDGYIKLVMSKEFTDLGLTANIYKRLKKI